LNSFFLSKWFTDFVKRSIFQSTIQGGWGDRVSNA
jgi:hypothetical protein